MPSLNTQVISRNGGLFTTEFFDNSGGYSSLDNVQVHNVKGTTIEPTRNHYVFGGWQDKEGNTLVKFYKTNGLSPHIGIDDISSTYVYVNDIKNGQTYYPIWYDLEAPTISNIASTTNFDTKQTVTMTAVDDGDGIAGYYIGQVEPTQANYNDKKFSFTSSTSATYSKELNTVGKWYFAVIDNAGNWKYTSRDYSSFSIDTSQSCVTSSTLTYKINHIFGEVNKSITLPTIKTTGYTANTWTDGSSTGLTSITMSNIGKTLSPEWKANKYCIYYNANGGDISVSEKEVTYKSSIGTLATPTRTGFDFTGWKDDSGNTITSSTVYDHTEAITIYAQWTVKSFNVTFKYGSDTYKNEACTTAYELASSSNYDYGTSIDLPKVYKKVGTFTHWKEEGSSTPLGDTYKVTKDVTLVPVFSDYGVDACIGYNCYTLGTSYVKYTYKSDIVDGVLTIPDTIVDDNGIKHRVVTIGGYASGTGAGSNGYFPGYARNSEITEVIMPDSIKYIGRAAFGACMNLKKIHFSKNVTSIEAVFDSCYALESIEIPENITDLKCAFMLCKNLKTVKLHDKVTNISGAFSYTALTELDIPDSVTDLTDCLLGCTSIEKVTFPSWIKEIPAGFFSGCSNLKTIDLPDGITKIGDNAFYNCTSLTSLKIPESVTDISYRAFENCYNLTELILPQNVSSIGSNAFYMCQGLTTLNIPDNVTTLSARSFFGCNHLQTVKLPDNIQTIEDNAFGADTKISTFIYKNTSYTSRRELYDALINNGVSVSGGINTLGA